MSKGERPVIRASDVVFMYAAGDPSLYDAFHGTVVGWGGRPRSRRPEDVERFRRRVEEAQGRGMRYCASVDFLVDFRGFIDFRPQTFSEAICRDLDGEPITVPWLWDHSYKGHPAYWFCTNNPDYRAYLRDQVERACLAPIDGLHIDDYRGTSACSAFMGGCFCDHCMRGFREFLRERLSKEELRELGIEEIDSFDYREFLRSKGITAERFRRERCPLGDLFQEFQDRRVTELLREIFEYAERLRGKPLLRSVNSNASSPYALLPAPLIDYFCGEVDHRASTGEVPLEPILVYKLVEGLGKRQTATASGRDWAWIKASEKPGLVRTWIAQAYAFGSTFMVPHNQWCYTPELGTHWWKGKPEDFGFLYGFVRDHAPLLDGYVSLARIAILYDERDFHVVREAALRMAELNIPFAIVFDPRELEGSPFDLLIVGEAARRGINGLIRLLDDGRFLSFDLDKLGLWCLVELK